MIGLVGLCERLRRDANYIWERIFKHPFVKELFTGTLPIEKFKYYVIQDYNYLIGMMRAYSILASKANYEVARVALEIAYLDATIEMENYIKLLERLGLTLDQVLKTEPAPTNMAYMNYLITTCSLGTPVECLVATLPCFWTYLEIAELYKEALQVNPNEIYRSWGMVYLGKEYKDLVKKLKDAIERYGKEEEYERYRKLFITSSRYEWMFWDMAYRMEKWPI